MSRDCVAMVTLTPVTPATADCTKLEVLLGDSGQLSEQNTHGDVCERQNVFVTHVKLFCERDELIPRFSKDPEDPSHVHKSEGSI